jgi:hypothetical protein
MPAYGKYQSYAGIRWYTLAYAWGTLGIGCMHFKHYAWIRGGIRMDTARQNLF